MCEVYWKGYCPSHSNFHDLKIKKTANQEKKLLDPTSVPYSQHEGILN